MRSDRVDETRGIACLLVLTFHAIGSEPGLTRSSWAYFTESLHFVRMPIFIAITGYLYGRSRGHRPLTAALWWKRMSRLWPPFLLVTGVVGVMDMAAGQRFNPVHAIAYGSWHLWYIQALAVILASMAFIETFVSPTSAKLWVASAVAALIAASGILAPIDILSIERAACLLPHFLAGAALGSTRSEVPKPLKITIYALGFLSLFLTQLSLAGLGRQWESGSLVATCLGLAGFMLVGTMAPESRPLRAIGVFSLPIFLWHLPFYAIVSFVLLHRIGAEPHWAVLTRIAVGLAGPMLLAYTVETKAPWATTLVGARDRRRVLADQEREEVRTSNVGRLHEASA